MGSEREGIYRWAVRGRGYTGGQCEGGDIQMGSVREGIYRWAVRGRGYTGGQCEGWG